MDLITSLMFLLLSHKVFCKTLLTTEGIKTTTKGEKVLLPCSACFGYLTNPDSDPRCAFGCGIEKIYPSATRYPYTLKPWVKSFDEITGVRALPLNVKEFTYRDKHFNVIVGLCVALVATLAVLIIVVSRKKTRVVTKHVYVAEANLRYLKVEKV